MKITVYNTGLNKRQNCVNTDTQLIKDTLGGRALS